MLEVFILSVVQGIAEFIPVSSSAHLILISKYFNFENSSLSLDLSLHFGSLLAILYYFRKDLFNFIHNRQLFLKIILSSLPVVFFGFILVKFDLIDYLRNYKIIGWSTIVFGFFLYFTDKFIAVKSMKKDFNYRNAFYIGCFQILALIPGASRSGMVMSGARFFNFKRVDAAKISFLMSIPILSAVSIFNTQQLIIKNNFNVSFLNLSGVFFSFLFSYLTIRFFIDFLQKFSLTSFVIYRIILGSVILIYAY